MFKPFEIYEYVVIGISTVFYNVLSVLCVLNNNNQLRTPALIITAVVDLLAILLIRAVIRDIKDPQPEEE